MNTQRHAARLALAAFAGALLLAGCHQDMWNQPKYKGLRPSDFFADGQSARPAVPGAVSYGGARRAWSAPVFAEITGQAVTPEVTEERFRTGKVDGAYMPGNYFPVTQELLERGRDRFEVNCMPCHGALGNGDGVVVSRGFPAPPSYHIPRLLEVEDGYLFDVITNGFGRMYSHKARVMPEDRWAIAAYIRALQLSQNVNLEALPEDARRAVEEDMAAAVAPAAQPEENADAH